MNDFEFGNFIYNLRKNAKLSQNELAKKLNVTNKAVSKWENGNCKPALNQLKELSQVFNVSLEELLNNLTKEVSKKITKIVITGGPCAGKSTAMSYIQSEFTKKGYAVLFVPETATELILGGIAPWTTKKTLDFQKAVLKLQIEKEKVFENAALTIANHNKILIVCDRGTLDGKAFLSDLDFYNMLKSLNYTEGSLRDDYDAVFHLTTSAKGAEEFYTLSNNKARTETLEEARESDDRLLNCYTGHPHLRVIDNSTNFENKMRRLIKEISTFLGEPQPLEIERKFLIKYPNIKQLTANFNCRKVEIIQTYLKSSTNEEIRVRQRGESGDFTYTKTIKKKISDAKRIEIEHRITESEYLNLLLEADTNKKQIRKTRYCLMYKNQYFEIDIYPMWKNQAIMEIELSDEKQEIIFPKFIQIIKEVTNDENYKNYNLAKLEN